MEKGGFILSSTTVSTEKTRVQALDILRGLAIFGMIFSGLIPWKGLPSWMYHAQVPPPDHIFNPNIPGISWVDLVYPFFMFSMGAAIPLALTRRLESGVSKLKIFGHIGWRFILMIALAIYIDNSAPWALFNNPPAVIWLRSLLGFGCILLMLARFPILDKLPQAARYGIRTLGFIGVSALMFTVVRENGGGFDKGSSDIIIRLLAFAYAFGSILWIISKGKPQLRMAVLAVVFALRIHTGASGKLVAFLDPVFGPLGWVCGFWFDLMLMILPGTFIGDALLEWSRSKKEDISQGCGLTSWRLGLMLLALPAIVVVSLICLKARWVYAGFFIVIALIALIQWLMRYAKTSMGNLMAYFFNWATLLLILGYIMEPYEGGIKKDPCNPSYFFTAVGLGITMLVFFFIIADGLGKGKWLGFLRVVGSNPMLAYITGNGVLFPLYFLLHGNVLMEPIVNLGVGWGLAWGAIETFLIFLIVYGFTRFKIYLRL
jgi:predicted acyltransferase